MGGTATGAYDSFNPAAIGAALESTLDALEEEGEGNEAGVAETVEGDAMGHERATKRFAEITPRSQAEAWSLDVRNSLAGTRMMGSGRRRSPAWRRRMASGSSRS
jgi:hypothetical protein